MSVLGKLTDWLQDRILGAVLVALSDQEQRVTTLDTARFDHERRLIALEHHVTTLDEAFAVVKDATDRGAEGQRAIAAELAKVREEVRAGNTSAIERLIPLGQLLNEHADALFAMASEGPANPVPVPVPDPTTGTTEPGTTEPGTVDPNAPVVEQGSTAAGV